MHLCLLGCLASEALVDNDSDVCNSDHKLNLAIAGERNTLQQAGMELYTYDAADAHLSHLRRSLSEFSHRGRGTLKKKPTTKKAMVAAIALTRVLEEISPQAVKPMQTTQINLSPSTSKTVQRS